MTVLDLEPRTTTLPDRDEPAVPAVPRTISPWRDSDVFSLLGAFATAVALTSLLFTQLTPLVGPLGFVVTTYLLFLVVYALLLSMDESGPAVRDRLSSVVVQGFAILIATCLVLLIGFTLLRGRDALGHLNFFTQDLQTAGPLQPLSDGGVRHAIIGTLEQIGIALLLTVPLGVTCAVFLNEIPGRFTRLVRTIVEAMTALPSVICGLFVYATLILLLGVEKSGIAAACALGLEMLPIIIRASDIVLRLVSGSLKEASYALGASQWRTVWNVVLPTARSGLTTAVILGTARGIGEAAPVLLTAGYTSATNANPFHGPQTSLPLVAFELVKSSSNNYIARGFGAAATLLLLVLVLFVTARIIGGRGPGSLTPRQERRRAAASRKDAARIEARPPLAAGPAPTNVNVRPTSPPAA